ncbi:uncharacterized protein LY89DRAFT_749086 [Mollisia scopiformis]|uniref:Uncharacterized protein n=1 Tax=Mollisia scopiformis TaxID=149040 RepID=A0A194X8D9_MOLSC|nr:uncharacterized protein LY89DRAFT_749086 [Mollisia scopiformis]KUJ16430.1 hypothetical protein LY89DRAFT_749086 [Mollisia scopiformis]
MAAQEGNTLEPATAPTLPVPPIVNSSTSGVTCKSILLHAPQQATAASTAMLPRKQFADLINVYFNRSKDEFLISGEHYIPLAHFLDPQGFPARKRSLESRIERPVVFVHVNNEKEPKTRVLKYDAFGGSAIFSNLAPPDLHSSHIVFMTGWQTGEWLRVLGAQCHIDPELFRRHLSFLDNVDFFDLPPLPSKCFSIWRLRVTTICNRQVELSRQAVKQGRDTDLEVVKRYQNELNASGVAGSSIIRRYAVHNEAVFTLEQDISISVHRKKNGGWLGMVWLDIGSSLEDGPSGPWNNHNNSPRAATSAFLPRVQQKPNAALYPPDLEDLIYEQPRNLDRIESVIGRHSQSATLLPMQYGLSLDRDTMWQDALYAFSDLLNFVASSENQFINYMEEQVKAASRVFRGQEEWSLETLKYSKALLDEHISNIERTISYLEIEGEPDFPRAMTSPGLGKSQATRKMLMGDFKYLLAHTKSASAAAREGMAIILEDVMLRDARKQIGQAREVGRLSLLAYFFLPLSLVTSIFGMNFVTFSDWKAAVGTSLAVYIAVMVISLALAFWDHMPWKRS